jgi:hypothetical protein
VGPSVITTLCYKLSIIPCQPQEVLMRTSGSRPTVTQFNLFHPPHPSPSWPGLPRETKQKTLKLLAQLLREHLSRVLASGNQKEARNE